MKLQLLVRLLIASATTFALPAISQPSPAKRVQYLCQMSSGIPVTFARTPKETIEVIRWQSRFFSSSGFTPEQRCQEVTERLQKHSDEGNLRFITTGKMSNQNVMCVAQSNGGGCRSDGLILTFEPKDNPQTVLADLFSVSTRARKQPITRGGQQKIYINVDEFLSNAASAKRGTIQGEARQPVNETPRSTTINNGSSNNNSADTCSNPNSFFCSN